MKKCTLLQGLTTVQLAKGSDAVQDQQIYYSAVHFEINKI
jgi:hypothetical protein